VIKTRDLAGCVRAAGFYIGAFTLTSVSRAKSDGDRIALRQMNHNGRMNHKQTFRQSLNIESGTEMYGLNSDLAHP
jgi:hypothetical protein